MFAIGNSSYPCFCGFGTWLDSTLSELSGTRLTNVGYGDELGDRDAEYKKWSQMAYAQACLEANLDLEYGANGKPEEHDKIITRWIPVDKNEAGVSLSESDKLCIGRIALLNLIKKN